MFDEDKSGTIEFKVSNHLRIITLDPAYPLITSGIHLCTFRYFTRTTGRKAEV